MTGFFSTGARVTRIAFMGFRALVAAIVVLTVCAAGTAAAPYVPTDDAIVLERLPERGDPRLRELKRMRATLATTPGNLDVAASVARRAIAASRVTGDPRFLG